MAVQVVWRNIQDRGNPRAELFDALHWKLETSSTTIVSGVDCPAARSLACQCCRPPASSFRSWPESLRQRRRRGLAVRAGNRQTLPFRKRTQLTSPTTGIPACAHVANCGWSEGTPGLTTIRSWSRKVRSPWRPSLSICRDPAAWKLLFCNCASALESETMTWLRVPAKKWPTTRRSAQSTTRTLFVLQLHLKSHCATNFALRKRRVWGVRVTATSRS